jgi:polyisoprenoid-binding protein YceI
MKTKLFFLAALVLSFTSLSAQRYICKTGHVWFYSHTPMEEIEAHNRQVVSILDPSTGDIQFNLLNRSFEFKVALMQEHYNENYMESDTYPKATFKGKITNLDKIDFKKDGTYEATVSGDLTMHGVTKQVTITGSILIKNGLPTAQAKFTVIPQDYNIIIPDLVKEKIAKEMEVTVDIAYLAN